MKYILLPILTILFFILFPISVNALFYDGITYPATEGETVTVGGVEKQTDYLLTFVSWEDDIVAQCYMDSDNFNNQVTLESGLDIAFSELNAYCFSYSSNPSGTIGWHTGWSWWTGTDWLQSLAYAPYLKDGIIAENVYSNLNYVLKNAYNIPTHYTPNGSLPQYYVIYEAQQGFPVVVEQPIIYNRPYRLIYNYYVDAFSKTFPQLIMSENPCYVDDNETDTLTIDDSTCGDITYASIDIEYLDEVQEQNIDLSKSFQYWDFFETNPTTIYPLEYTNTEDKCVNLIDSNYILYDNSNNPICTSLSNPYLDEIFPPFTRLQFEQLDIEAIETEFKSGSFDFLWVAVEPVLRFLNLAIDFFNSIMDILVTGYRFIANLLLPNVLDIGFQIDTFRNYMTNDLLLVQNAFVFTNMVSEIFDVTTSDVPDPITFNFRGDTMTILDLSNFNWNLLVTIRILTGISYFIAIAFVIRSMVIQILGRYTTLNIRDIPIKVD